MSKSELTSVLFLLFCFAVFPSVNIMLANQNANAGVEVVDWWPMFQHDPQHTGYTTSKVCSAMLPLWNFSTQGLGNVSSSPAIANGLVFVGSDDNNIYALAEDTGETVWVKPTLGDVHSSPAVADGIVYVGSYDNCIYALNASTGELVWGINLMRKVYASPVVAYGNVYVIAFSGIDDSSAQIYCLDKDDGTNIWNWTIQVLDGLNVKAYSSPAISGGLVFFAACQTDVYPWRSDFFALYANNGSIRWRAPLNNKDVYSSPSVTTGARVFFGSDDGYLYALDHDTGNIHWKVALGEAIRSSPATGYGMVFVGSNDGKIYAFNQLGAFVWNFTTGGPVRSSPVVADEKVVVGSDDGYLYVLNAYDGALIWKSFVVAAVESSPAVANGNIYIGSNDGKVYAFGPSHDIAVLNIVPFATVVVQNYSMSINVTIENQGCFEEANIGVTLYANDTEIQTLNIPDLASSEKATLTITWNTTNFALGNYTIVAYVSPVEGEKDTADNEAIAEVEIAVIPEFPLFLLLPLFMIATLLLVIVYNRKHASTLSRR